MVTPGMRAPGSELKYQILSAIVTETCAGFCIDGKIDNLD